jgi:hypothetical protein
MTAQEGIPATTTTTDVVALARRVVAAFGTGDHISDGDITLMRSLRPTHPKSDESDIEDEDDDVQPADDAESLSADPEPAGSEPADPEPAGTAASDTETSDTETSGDEVDHDAYLDVLPEDARGLFGWIVNEVVDSDAGASMETIRESIRRSASYNYFCDRTPEFEPPSFAFRRPGWSPDDLFSIRTADGPGTGFVRERVPGDDVPGDLTPADADESVAEAASLDGLGDTSGLPRVTRHRLTTEPAWYVGEPRVEDVSQGRRLGDCYLLGLFAAIARHDPGMLRRILPPETFEHLHQILNPDVYHFVRGKWTHGDCALVNLWRNLGTGPDPFYLPQMFQVSPLLPHDMGGIAGVRLRVEAQREQWTLRRQAAGRYVECVKEYRPVTWPALLEKAFATYLENFGTSGAGPKAEGRGYRILGEGSLLGQAFFRTLYGPRVHLEEKVRLEPLCRYVSGEDASDEMPEVRRALQGLLKVHAQTHRAEPGTYAVLMTAGASDLNVVMRLQALLDKHHPSLATLGAFTRALTAVAEAEMLGTQVQGQEHLTADRPELSEEEIERRQEEALAALHEAAGPTLEEVEGVIEKSSSPAAHLSLMRDLLLTLCAPDAPDGDDSTARRVLYTRHSYALLDANLAFTGEGAIPDPDRFDAMADLLPRLDAARSTVTLYNPHGQNSCNADGPVPGDTGRFTLALDRFLNVAHRINYTTVLR